MKKTAKVKGDRAQGLLAPPYRLMHSRDPIRRFSRFALEQAFEAHGYSCFNPFCEFADVPLHAHHIYAHALGGKSVINNAIVLCRYCHDLVHRGVIPLSIIISWKQNIIDEPEPLFSDSEELLLAVRLVPISTVLSPHERLIKLNRYLVQANLLKSLIARNFISAQIMLAKSAVLNDSYRDIAEDIESASRSMKTRYKRMLPFTASASYLGSEVKSPAVTVRALHYRSIVYDTVGNLYRALESLRQAWNICERVSPQGKPDQFHELSTPARILRSMGLIRARLGGRKTQSNREYNLGLSLAEKYGELEDWHEAKLRHIQLNIVLGELTDAERELSSLWDEVLSLDANSQLIAHRLRIEMLLHKRVNKNIIMDLLYPALQKASLHRLYRQEHHLFRLKKKVMMVNKEAL